MKIESRVYDFLKPFALVVLPAVSALYVGLGAIWGLPNVQEIVGSITVINTFLGATLHVSSKSYTPPADGTLVVDKSNPAKDTYSLQVDTPLDELDDKKSIVLTVTPKG